ncbi:MAG: hypothetical protein MJ188_03690 [Treponema sp.]|nr:hypothetical protein [Treponema sp.]
MKDFTKKNDKSVKHNNIENTQNTEKIFLITVCCLSVVISLLYIWNGLLEQFYIATYIFIGLHLLFIPVILLCKKNRRKGFAIYSLIYAVCLVFIIAFHKTYLYNNLTGVLIIFIVVLIMPNYKKWAFGIYFLAVSVAFAFNEENLCHYLIHISRFALAFFIFDYIMEERYSEKKLILYDDEIKILTALSKNRLQKSIELDGFSESTIYRRIKSACQRNKMTKEQLLEEFKKTYVTE